MPDITMCVNSHCPSAGSCYRHEAPPNDLRQSYAHFSPDTRGRCDHFIPLREENSDVS